MFRISSLHRINPLLGVAKKNRFLSGLTIFYIFSVFWGAYRFYSPIPQLDMWDGYINFYLQLLEGDNSIWWSQHNEHRPILSRVLFYIDLAFLGGQSRLLVPMNVFFVFVVWYMVLSYAFRFLHEKSELTSFYYVLVLLTVCTLSWKQDENIIWAFQSHFWVAYLLPLLGFHFLAKSEAEKEKEGRYFILSCVLGILSAGTMANGIFALPMLFVMSLALRKRISFSVTLAFVTILVMGMYLYDFHTPVEHNSIIENIIHRPWQTIVFFIEYVGAPPKNIYASFVFGLIHLYLIFVVLANVKQHKDNPFYLSIVAFLLYYLATAVVTSGGRVNLGFNAALVGRYTTPAFISFSLSLILYLYVRPQHFRYFGKRTVIILAVLMLGTQARTVIKNVDKIHDIRDRETLQMELGTYYYQQFQKVAERAYLKNISVFGLEPFRDKREKMGLKINESDCRQIEFSPSPVKHINMLSVNEKIPVNEAVFVTNKQKKIIGYGLSSRQYNKSVSIIYGKQVDKGNGILLLYRCH